MLSRRQAERVPVPRFAIVAGAETFTIFGMLSLGGSGAGANIYTVESCLGILTITRFFSTSIVIFCLSMEAGIATVQKYPLFSLGDTA
jgi:hypothetical protein